MTHPKANQGKWFESLVEQVTTNYERKGIMRLRKVDPPTFMYNGQWVRKQSPFLDYVGTWTERNGRAIFLECKTTSHGKLPMLSKSGLTDDQYKALKDWHLAGAVSCLLWANRSMVALVTASQLQTHIERATQMHTARCLTFEDLEAKFSIAEIYSFVSAIRAYYDKKQDKEEALPLFREKREVGV